LIFFFQFSECRADSLLDKANALLLRNFDSIGSINIFCVCLAFAVTVFIEFNLPKFMRVNDRFTMRCVPSGSVAGADPLKFDLRLL